MIASSTVLERPFLWTPARGMPGKETKKKARVMVHDPVSRTNKEVAVGPFADVAWLRKGVLIVRKEDTELWELSVRDKAMTRIFPN